MDTIIIQHRFTIEQNGTKFTDAIVLPQDEYNQLTVQQIESLKQERFENWVQVVNTPPVEVVEEPEVLESKLVDIEAQIENLTLLKTEVESKLNVSNVREPIKGSIGVK